MNFTTLNVELQALLISVCILLVTILGQQLYTDVAEGISFTFSNRLKPFKTETSQRLAKTVRNSVENLVMFAPIALLLAFQNISTTYTQTGAWVFVIARVIFVLSFAFGVKYIRSTAWFAGIIGLIMMIWPLVF